MPAHDLLYRCAGPNCGLLKGDSDRWWMMWTARADGIPVLSISPWDEALARKEATLHVCGEGCAQKLQSIFLANVRGNQDAARAAKARP